MWVQLVLLAWATPVGFQPGMDVLDEPLVSAERCAVCHVDEAAQWASSRHAVAHTNPIYQQGLLDEPMAFCVRCHSPLAEQVAEVEPAVAVWARQARAERQLAPVTGGAASEGITCVVCHQRDGQILATSNSGRSPHDVRVEPALGTSEWCGSCHQFEMFRATPHGVTSTGELMQATLQEWQAWGGRQSCQDCHMPDGAHTFAGAHDVSQLRDSVQVRVRPGRLRLRSVGVGHELPSGDLFRHITVRAWTTEGVQDVARLGRSWTVDTDVQPMVKRLAANTSLQPGVWRDIDLPTGSMRWEVRYHYGSPYDEHRHQDGLQDWVVTLHEGDARW